MWKVHELTKLRNLNISYQDPFVQCSVLQKFVDSLSGEVTVSGCQEESQIEITALTVTGETRFFQGEEIELKLSVINPSNEYAEYKWEALDSSDIADCIFMRCIRSDQTKIHSHIL